MASLDIFYLNYSNHSDEDDLPEALAAISSQCNMGKSSSNSSLDKQVQPPIYPPVRFIMPARDAIKIYFSIKRFFSYWSHCRKALFTVCLDYFILQEKYPTTNIQFRETGEIIMKKKINQCTFKGIVHLKWKSCNHSLTLTPNMVDFLSCTEHTHTQICFWRTS